jgi:OPT oligopeptide transporter protein
MIIAFFATLFTIFACAVMSYISMATPIGPWIETTIVLLGTLVFRVIFQTVAQREKALSFTTVAAGIGGIVATGLGFSFPTLYFLAPAIFNHWLSMPTYFCAIVGALVITAGSFGFLIANMLEKTMLADPQMAFSVGQMVHKMIAAQHNIKQAINLAWGMVSAIFYSISETFLKIIPAQLLILPQFNVGSFLSVPKISLTMTTLPLFIAVGFVTGHVLAVPLIVGIISKIFLVDPLHHHLFQSLSSSNFLLAFSSGMILQGTLLSFKDLPKIFKNTLKQMRQKSSSNFMSLFDHISRFEIAAVVLSTAVFLWYLNVSFLGQLYLLLFTAVCIYQILLIAGKIGIAPLGRYATFVLMPGLLLFNYDPVQVMIISTFVEIACGVAADTLFGRKMAALGQVNHKKIVMYQWLGIIVSALCCGIIFWLLITHFGLNNAYLFALKAQNRAVLVNAFQFDVKVIVLGIIFGFGLMSVKVNPVLVLGGLMMPIESSLQLVAGGLLTYCVKNKEEYYPFWSGVFATSSLWIILKTLF